VTVRGDGLVRTEPDEAVLWITLTALEDRPERRRPMSRLAPRPLVALLDEVGVREG
jgi:hypothetical protein